MQPPTQGFIERRFHESEIALPQPQAFGRRTGIQGSGGGIRETRSQPERGEYIPGKRLPFIGTDHVGMAVQDLLQERRTRTGKTGEHGRAGGSPFDGFLLPALIVVRRE
jgi:hypothetical protein